MRVKKPKERNELPKNDASNNAWVIHVAISSELFWDIHTTSLNKNTGKHSRCWAHKNEQLNHSYSLKPLVTAVQVYVIQGTNTANRMHESAIWWVPSRLPWRFLWHGYMEAARAGFGSWSVSQYFYLTWHCGTYTQTASSLLFFFAKPLHA